MSEERATNKIYRGKIEGRRKAGRPRKRWLDEVEKDLKAMKIKNWRIKARDREGWRCVAKEAKVLRGL